MAEKQLCYFEANQLCEGNTVKDWARMIMDGIKPLDTEEKAIEELT